MRRIKETLDALLSGMGEFTNNADKVIDYNKVKAAADDLDESLIASLWGRGVILRQAFFKEIGGAVIFNAKSFKIFLDENKVNNSYTDFANRIGLADAYNHIIDRGEVVLNFPYKDCVLEGGQTKDDQKRNEIFYNEIIAKDEIDRLLDPKALVNWKRITAKGEEKVTAIKRHPDGTIADNLLIKGNNLIALHSLKEQFAGKVKLIYIDPPFNTGKDSFKYNDRFSQSTWLTFMKNRLEVAKELLADDGNIFIHIDINHSHYLKVLCDETFNKENFVEEIIWAYGSPSGGRASGAKPVNIHDYIFHYAKKYSQRKQNKIYIEYSEKYIKEWFKYQDKGGKFQKRMRGKDENGNPIWEKQYLQESNGVPLSSVWSDIKQVYADPRAYKENQKAYSELSKEFGQGQKPEKLLQRIVSMASNEGDIILDYHLGSGTTAAVAHKMGRQYIGIEQLDYGENDSVTRLKKVIAGDQSGISQSVNWQGGGDFLYLELAKWNEQAKEAMLAAKDLPALKKLFDDCYETYFLNYNVDIAKLKEEIATAEFAQKPLAEQKRYFIEMLDMNQMYVHATEMADKKFAIAPADQKLTKEFYGGDDE